MQSEGFAFDTHDTIDGGHGWIETRKYVMTFDIGWLQEKAIWPGLKCIGMVKSSRNVNGECSHEKRYYISSLDCDAQEIWQCGEKPLGH